MTAALALLATALLGADGAQGCYAAALDALEAHRDGEAAVELRCACEGGMADGCTAAGRLYERVGNISRANEYYAKARALGADAPNVDAVPVIESPEPATPPQAPLGRWSPTFAIGSTYPVTTASSNGPPPLGGLTTGQPGLALGAGARFRFGPSARNSLELAWRPAVAVAVGYGWEFPFEAVSVTGRFEMNGIDPEWSALPALRGYAFASLLAAHGSAGQREGQGYGARVGIGVGLAEWTLMPKGAALLVAGSLAPALVLTAVSALGVTLITAYSPQLELYWEKVQVGLITYEGLRVGVALGF